MSQRIEVSSGCVTPCVGCAACRHDGRFPNVADVVRRASGAEEVVLGGGDPLAWPGLAGCLSELAGLEPAPAVWIESPLGRELPAGVAGVVLQIGIADRDESEAGLAAVAAAEAAGLMVRARVCARADRVAALGALLDALGPRMTWVELAPPPSPRPTSAPVPEAAAAATAPALSHIAALDAVMARSRHARFSAHRMAGRGYVPPCLMPSAWKRNPEAWRATLNERPRRNDALPACGACSLAMRCQWREPALDAGGARPLALDGGALPWERRRGPQLVPPQIVALRSEPEVVCVSPWTTMEITDPDGDVEQCCGSWNVGVRGNALETSLAEVWNGSGYQAARRIMSGADIDPLCLPVCPRRHDHKHAERHLRILDGAAAFVDNQLRLAEEIARRREVLTARPLYLVLCGGTYCNYDCIMCVCGRTPRRDLPLEIWEEVFDFLPTLHNLTITGGEPLANQVVMDFLRRYDRDRYPDAGVSLITNGALLTRQALRHLRKCAFRSVTVSLNAGTPEAYEHVQRGLPLRDVLDNIDALIAYRSELRQDFKIAVSCVVLPENAATLIDFGEIARARGLEVRMLPLAPHGPAGRDYYDDPDTVARLVEQLDGFASWAQRSLPDAVREIGATRDAIAGEAAARRRGAAGSLVTLRIPGRTRAPGA